MTSTEDQDESITLENWIIILPGMLSILPLIIVEWLWREIQLRELFAYSVVWILISIVVPWLVIVPISLTLLRLLIEEDQ